MIWLSLEELLVIEILLKFQIAFRDNYRFSQFNTFKAVQKTSHKSAAGIGKILLEQTLFTTKNP